MFKNDLIKHLLFSKIIKNKTTDTDVKTKLRWILDLMTQVQNYLKFHGYDDHWPTWEGLWVNIENKRLVVNMMRIEDMRDEVFKYKIFNQPLGSFRQKRAAMTWSVGMCAWYIIAMRFFIDYF